MVNRRVLQQPKIAPQTLLLAQIVADWGNVHAPLFLLNVRSEGQAKIFESKL